MTLKNTTAPKRIAASHHGKGCMCYDVLFMLENMCQNNGYAKTCHFSRQHVLTVPNRTVEFVGFHGSFRVGLARVDEKPSFLLSQ